MKHKRVRLLIIIALSMTILAACGGKDTKPASKLRNIL